MTNPLSRCPCGEVPNGLFCEQAETYKSYWVSGTCCGNWNVYVKVPHDLSEEIAGAKCDERAAWIEREWNAAPRGNEQ